MCRDKVCPCNKSTAIKDKETLKELRENRSTILGYKDENEICFLTKILEIIFYQFKLSNDHASLK